MTLTATVECNFRIRRVRHGHKILRARAANFDPGVDVVAGSIPRVARLMALAWRFDTLLHDGVVASYAALADLGHVSRARISQIMNLLQLAPDIQEAILFLPRTRRGRDPIHLRRLQPITRILSWKKQRRLWTRMRPA